MKIDVHARRFELTESLRQAVHREIARLAQALGAGITRVSVRLFDVNGLRGGPDKGCLVHARFTDGTSIVAVTWTRTCTARYRPRSRRFCAAAHEPRAPHALRRHEPRAQLNPA